MIVTARYVRQTVEASLKARLPAFLTVISNQPGAEPLTAIKTWRRMADFTGLREQDSPAVVVTTLGVPTPETEEGGGHRAAWGVRVFIVARGRTYEETADRVADYVAAVRVALLADPSLGGAAEQVIWQGETYTELDRTEQRTIAAGSVTVSYTFTTDLGETTTPIVEATGDYSLLPVHPAL